jgi:hypothetical protein
MRLDSFTMTNMLRNFIGQYERFDVDIQGVGI